MTRFFIIDLDKVRILYTEDAALAEMFKHHDDFFVLDSDEMVSIHKGRVDRTQEADRDYLNEHRAPRQWKNDKGQWIDWDAKKATLGDGPDRRTGSDVNGEKNGQERCRTDQMAAEVRRMRHRIECLRGGLKSAAGWLLDADDLEGHEKCLDMAGDMEPPMCARLSMRDNV